MKNLFKLLIPLILLTENIKSQCTPPSNSCPNYSGCTYQPLHYYTFDNTCAPLGNCLQNGQNVSALYNSQITSLSSSPLVGTFERITIGSNSSNVQHFPAFFPDGTGSDANCYVNSGEYTFEFVFRINSSSFSNIQIGIKDDSFFRLSSSGLFFQAGYNIPGPNNSTIFTSDMASCNLGGLGGIFTSCYFQDQNWHHVACKFNGNIGFMELWIDGQLAANKSITSGATPYQPNINQLEDIPTINLLGLQTNGTVDLDEVIFYDKALPTQLIYQHYLDIQNGQHYSCTFNSNLIVPVACPDYTGCTYQPLHYYTFDNSHAPLSNCYQSCQSASGILGSQLISLSSSPAVRTYNRIIPGSSNNVQNFPAFFPDGSGSSAKCYVNSREYTFEFVLRINSDFYSNVQIGIKDDSFFRLTPSIMFFQAGYNSPGPNNSTIFTSDMASCALRGVGKFSTSYFQDRNWHHVVCKFDGNNGFIELWIDGQTAVQLHTPIAVGSVPYQPNVGQIEDIPTINIQGLEDNGTIDIDEVAFYNQALPVQLICQHYSDIQNGQHYSCTYNSGITVPSPIDVSATGSYDPLDFVPGHPFVNNIPATLDDLGSNVPSVLHQFQDIPLPRYKKSHGLNQNINWMDNTFLGRVNKIPNATNDIQIQDEMCKHWNYMFSLNPNASVGPVAYQSQLNNFANTNSQYKYSIGSNLNFVLNDPAVLAAPEDIVNTSNSCPALTGYMAPNAQTNSYFAALGQANLAQIVNNVINDPTTPLTANINYLSENGFERPLFDLDNTGCPYSSAMSSQNLFSNSFGADWQSYYGQCRNSLTTTYKNQIIGQNPQIPSGTKYSEYLISAAREHDYFEDYAQMRGVNTAFVSNNNNFYYSTPPFYPFQPQLWLINNFPGTNWAWGDLMGTTLSTGNGRMKEIQLGDSLFAPFVSGGWEYEFRNMRPGQWLGLLKGLGIIGADYYHTGYFNVTTGGLFATQTSNPVDPKGWCYQAVMPSYAQGITSRYEKYLHASSIVYHRVRNMNLTVVRALTQQSSRFLIYSALQQLNNRSGNTPLNAIYHFDDVSSGSLNGLKFEVRRQGSTYIFDASSLLFYQLDKWHESTHPSYWNKDFEFEAELNDYTGTNNSLGLNDYINNTMQLNTEVPNNTPALDFTNYTTFVSYTGSAPLKSYYYFEPRDANGNNSKTYYFWMRARSINASASSKINVTIKQVGSSNIISQVTIPCIQNQNNLFGWYNFYVAQNQVGVPVSTGLSFNVTANTEYEIEIEGNSTVQFDKFILSESSILPTGISASETITPCAYSNRISGLSQNKNQTHADLIVRPNPNNGKFIVALSSEDKDYIEELVIFDSQGIQVFSQKFLNNEKKTQEIDLKNCGNGIYFIKVTTSSSKFRNKIIITD